MNQEQKPKKISSPGIEMKDFGKKYVTFAPLVRSTSGGKTQLGSRFPESEKFASQEGERLSRDFWQSKVESVSAKNDMRDVKNLKDLLDRAVRVSGNPSDTALKGLVILNKMRYSPNSVTGQSLGRLLDDSYRSSVLEEISITNTSARDIEGKGINLKNKKSKKRKLKSKKLLKKGRRFTKSKSKSRKQKNKH